MTRGLNANTANASGLQTKRWDEDVQFSELFDNLDEYTYYYYTAKFKQPSIPSRITLTPLNAKLVYNVCTLVSSNNQVRL